MAYPAYWHNAFWSQAWQEGSEYRIDQNAYSVAPSAGDYTLGMIWSSGDFDDPADARSLLIKDENDTFYYAYISNDTFNFQIFNEEEEVDETYSTADPASRNANSTRIVLRKKTETLWDVVCFGITVVPGEPGHYISTFYLQHYSYTLGGSLTLLATFTQAPGDEFWRGEKSCALLGGKLTFVFMYDGADYMDYWGWAQATIYDLDSLSLVSEELFHWKNAREEFLWQSDGEITLPTTGGYAFSAGYDGNVITAKIIFAGCTESIFCSNGRQEYFVPNVNELRKVTNTFSASGRTEDELVWDSALLWASGYSDLRCNFIGSDPASGPMFTYRYHKKWSVAEACKYGMPILPPAEFSETYEVIDNGSAYTETYGNSIPLRGMVLDGSIYTEIIIDRKTGTVYCNGHEGMSAFRSSGQLNDNDPPVWMWTELVGPDAHDIQQHRHTNLTTLGGDLHAIIVASNFGEYCPTGFMGKWPITAVPGMIGTQGYAIWGTPFIDSDKGIFVQTTELDTSGSISGSRIEALGLGEPEGGDKAAWNIFEYPTIHADDIYRDHHHYHSPVPDDVGQSPVWNGTKWMPGYVMTDGGEYGWDDHWHLEEDITDMLHDATHIRGVQVIDDPTANEYLMYNDTSGSYISNPLTSEKEILGLKQLGLASSGSLGATGSIPTRLLSPWEGTIQKVVLSSDPPGGQSLIADVNKNGTTIFTDQGHRPAIAVGDTTGDTTDIDINSVSVNDVFTIDVDQIGTSGSPGGNLSIYIVVNT